MSPEAAARIIAGAVGRRGACRDYLADTVGHLAALGLTDASLKRLAKHVAALVAATA